MCKYVFAVILTLACLSRRDTYFYFCADVVQMDDT